MRRIGSAAMAAIAVLVAAPGADATGRGAGLGLELERVRAAAQRCEGMSVMLRDPRTGGSMPLGAAEDVRAVPIPGDGAAEIACFDGYLVPLEGAPVAVGGPKARVTVVAEQEAAIRAVRALAPEAEIVARYSTVLNALHVRMPLRAAERVRDAGLQLHENGEVQVDLAESLPMINADDVWTGSTGATGKGVRVAVVDTGVDYTHPALGGCFGTTTSLLSKPSPCKVAGGYDVTNGDPDPMDDHGHGTHVAAIAAGAEDNPGVAPGATLYAYKVLDATGWGTEAHVIEGVERAVDPNDDGVTSDGAHVINLSLGGPGAPNEPLAQAADNAVAAGAVVVASAGNATWRYQDEGNVTSPGVAPRAITVGASTKDDWMAFYSSRGPVEWDGKAIVKPDLVAPGTAICAARSGTWTAEGICDAEGRRVAASGTSMAAPHVAGVAALLREVRGSLTPDQVKAVLKGSAAQLARPESALAQGAGRVDAEAAVGRAIDPPVALLDPIPTLGEVRRVAGTVEAPAGLMRWTLSAALFRTPQSPESGWATIASGTSTPTTRTLHDLAVRTLPDGRYIMRLTVEDARGRSAVDYGHLSVDKLGFEEPLDLDVQRGGTVVPMRIRVDAAISGAEYALEMRPDVAGSGWTTVSNGDAPPVGWDASELAAGQYRLRLTVTHDGFSESDEVRVSLDPTLAPGFPVRVPLATPCAPFSEPCSLKAGWADPVVADLDGDGASELVVQRHAAIPEILIYDGQGRLLSTTPVGTAPLPSHYYALHVLHPTPVADLDLDGDREVLFFNPFEQRLFVVGATGAVERSIAVPLEGGMPIFPRLVTADLDVNGSTEVLLSVQVAGRDRLVVLDPVTATRRADWWVSPAAGPMHFYSAEYGYAPAVGNLDSDAALEIVAVDQASARIAAFDANGSMLPGWPVQGDAGGRPNAPPVIGDVDGDGRNEVVAAVILGATSKVDLHVLDQRGAELPGWPLRSATLRLFGGPVVADVAPGDGLEIVVPFTSGTRVHRHDGSTLPGWPVASSGRGDYQPIVADVDRDGRQDVLQHEGSLGKGVIRAWTAGGAAAPGFGLILERSSRAPLTLDAEAGLLVAASDSDAYWDERGIPRSKHRASIHLWEVELGAAAWPTFQGDADRTGNGS